MKFMRCKVKGERNISVSTGEGKLDRKYRLKVEVISQKQYIVLKGSDFAMLYAYRLIIIKLH